MKDALNFIMRGSEVSRYHTVVTIKGETVGHHSHGVACLVLILNQSASRNLMIAALLHDLSEQYTGDIPSPAKREFGIGAQVSELELLLMERVGIIFPTLSEEEKRVLKLADIAHGALFCVRELSMGNSNVAVVYDRYMAYAHNMGLSGTEERLFNLISEMRHEC